MTFVFGISAFMFYPENALLDTTHSDDFKNRIILSFLTITLLSAFYEYPRQQSFAYVVELRKKYEQLARPDPLTQLSNRRDAMETLDYEVNRIERNNCPIALILCDIDFFKQINDKYGHDADDHTLVMLDQLFTETLRKQDTVARWGRRILIYSTTNHIGASENSR